MSSTSFVARSSSYFLPKMESHSSFHSEEESVDTPRSESPLFTPPQRMAPSAGRDVGYTTGRPRKSPVWDFFEFDDAAEKTVCQVMKSSDSTHSSSFDEARCGHSLTGKFATNMKNHLKKAHPKEYQLVLRKEETMAKENASKKSKTMPKRHDSQMTLGEAFQRKYDPKSQQCQRITRRLAIFVGSSNVPNSLVENREFQSLLEALDPRYPIPGRTLLGREIEKVLFDMKANIRRVLSAAQKVSLCADIWTKKGMMSSDSAFLRSAGPQASSSRTCGEENSSPTQCRKHP